MDNLHIFLGATVADAATRPLHWVYDPKKLKKYIKGKKEIVFLKKNRSPFYNIKTGNVSGYNDVGQVMFRTLLSSKTNVLKNFKKNVVGESFFYEGVYTACECDLKKDETPIWRLESKLIKHDPKTQTVYLKHPVMKIFSLPVYYLPYLSFPDWTVKRKSGFLTPSYGYSKRNRFYIKIPFFLVRHSEALCKLVNYVNEFLRW